MDRLVIIKALENFGFECYDIFFKFAYNALPANGVILLHSIPKLHPKQVIERSIAMLIQITKFISSGS